MYNKILKIIQILKEIFSLLRKIVNLGSGFLKDGIAASIPTHLRCRARPSTCVNVQSDLKRIKLWASNARNSTNKFHIRNFMFNK